jgi:lysophospholipid acyltransferase (LPLAT)-like uncharacterized protein
MNKPFTPWQRFLLFIAGTVGPVLIRILGFTWKVRVAGATKVHPQRYKTEKRIYCFWHNRLLALCFTQRKKNVGIMISSHFDGEVIARIVSRMGYRALRGSSTRGGAAGLLSMLKNDEVWYLAITVDGPRGPREVVKPGAIFLASRSGLPIIPVSANSSSKWVLSSWDRFEIPKPFATVTVALGEPIYAENVTGHQGIKQYSDTLAQALEDLKKCT